MLFVRDRKRNVASAGGGGFEEDVFESRAFATLFMTTFCHRLAVCFISYHLY